MVQLHRFWMTQNIEPVPFFSSLFDAAVEVAQPEKTIHRYLPEKPKGRLIVVGGGKASAQMGRAFEDAWMERHGEAVEGVIVTRYGYACECLNLEVLEAAHPVPDKAGFEGAMRLLETVSNLTEDDLVVALVSGGGSALLPCPPEGLTLADEIAGQRGFACFRRSDFRDEYGAQARIWNKGRTACGGSVSGQGCFAAGIGYSG